MSTYGLPPGREAWYRRPGGKRRVKCWQVGTSVFGKAVHVFVRSRFCWLPAKWICPPKPLTVKQKKLKENPCAAAGPLL